jgi:acyl-CoA thioester hydrolase
MEQTVLSKFKHKYQVRVRYFEVDSQAVVHNARYLEYCEAARVEYIRDLGRKVLPGAADDNIKVMIKKNEIVYHCPAMLDDLLDIYTRASFIKNSSLGFEQILVNHENGTFICTLNVVHVYLDPVSGEPVRIPDEYRNQFRDFEKGDIEFIESIC